MGNSVPFLFQIRRKTNRKMICNNNNNRHYIKRSIPKSRFQRKSIFPIRNTWREQVDKQWLQIYMGRKCVFIRMQRLRMYILQHSRVTITIWKIFWFGQVWREKKTWANKVGLISMFEIEWKRPHHNILNFWTIGSWILNIIESRFCWGTSKK
jgi:hypothetical protein